MSDQAALRDELFALLGRLADESITSEQAGRLQNILAASPEAREDYLDFTALHVHLELEHALAEDDLSAVLSLDSASADVTDQATKSESGRLHRRTVRFFAQPTPFSMSIAALFIGVLVTAMALIAPPVYRAMTGGSVPAEVAPPRPLVAQLTGLHDAVWEEHQIATYHGSYLQRGHRMVLLAGLVEVTYGQGVVVLLEGPAAYVVTGDGLGTLEHGKLTAVVGESAHGFTIATPTAQIVDLGTEFGVAVDEEGATEASVFKGAVEVSLLDDASTTVRLEAGQSVRTTSAGLDVLPPETPADFVRQLPEPPAPSVSAVGLVNGDFTSPLLGGSRLNVADIDGGWFAKGAGRDWLLSGGALVQRGNSGSKTRVGQVFRTHEMRGAQWVLALDLHRKKITRIEVFAGKARAGQPPDARIFDFNRDTPPTPAVVAGPEWTKLIELSDVAPGSVEAPIEHEIQDFDLIAIRFIGDSGTIGAAIDNVRFENRAVGADRAEGGNVTTAE